MATHPNTFHLIIASVGQTHFDGPALSVTVPGTAGEFTVLPNHEPIVTTLKEGKVVVKAQDGVKDFQVAGGVLECSGTRVVVLL